jgi:tRNA nucleotidyltransferase (CCA-adding enzyme)
MKEYLKKLPKEIQNLIYCAQDIACKNNMPVYLVGGFVRDLLLGVKNLDLDITVEGDGIKFAEDFAAHLKAKLIRHRRFGTATVILDRFRKIYPSTLSPGFVRDDLELAEGSLRVNGERSRTIDIASARKEYYPQSAHLPVVSSATLKEDLFRRDFTINAMAINLGCENFGKLIDYFGGKSDLDNKKIRLLHALSFLDDPTRILRAIRFETRYNFKIEPKTLKFLKEALKVRMLDRLEPQRIRDDLILMLKEEYPIKEIRRLQRLSGFDFISPQILVTKKTYKLLKAVGLEIIWFKKYYPKTRHIDAWLIYLMALLKGLSISETNKLCRRFAFRKGEEKRIMGFKLINHKVISRLNKKEIRPSKITAILGPLSYEAILLLKAEYENRRIQQYIKDFFQYYNDTRIHISGHDLHRLGISPGPNYQKILKKVLNAKLDGSVRTKEEELRLIKKISEGIRQ